MKKKLNGKIKIFRKFKYIFILFLLILILQYGSENIIFLIGNLFQNQKYWVGGKYQILKKKYLENNDEKIYLKSLYNKTVELSNGFILMKSSGKECLNIYTKNKKINTKICFNIYDIPKLSFKETNPIKLETYNSMQLHLDRRDYPKINIIYESNYPGIVKVNNEGLIFAERPGWAIITASDLNGKKTQIKVLATSNNGFISNYTLNNHNASQYKKLMIVAHPDDETLWGGGKLFKDRYFVVCLTNGYHSRRANEFKKLLQFTNNSGIILNYPDIQSHIKDNWSEVENGILKDLSKILNYQYWDKIVTHGLEGTTGHIHHKKTSYYVTIIAKKYNKYNNLYYFGKFYRKRNVPKNLARISNEELYYKRKEIKIYKSQLKCIYALWYHMIPYENWILASKWKK